MARSSSTSYPYEAKIDFKREYLRDGLHLAALPIDTPLAALIGLVTAYWAYYETMFNQLLSQLLVAAERDERNWHIRSFSKRTRLAREVLDLVKFPAGDEEGKRRIKKCLGQASDLQWRRNVIVHGSYRLSIAPHSQDAIFHADGTHNGRSVTVCLDPETLQKLWHDIAHLCGEFIQIGAILGSIGGLSYTLPDKHLLDLFREWDLKNPPTQ